MELPVLFLRGFVFIFTNRTDPDEMLDCAPFHLGLHCLPSTCLYVSRMKRVKGLVTVKPVLSSHSKIDKTRILFTNGSLMKVKVLQNAPLGAFCNTFDLH